MGGAPSKTRKLTVENDDPTSVIKVSEGVVDRIRGSQMVRQEVPVNPTVPPHTGHFVPAPFFYNEHPLTSIQLRQANVAELKENDKYWENRIRNLETNHKKLHDIIDEEQKKAIDEVLGSKKKVKAVLTKPPCLDKRRAVMECYRNNPREPMKCAKVVQAFQECVDLKRSCLVASRG